MWNYTVDHIYFGPYLPCSWWTFTLLLSMARGMNALQSSYKKYNFTLTVSRLPDTI